MRRRQLHLRRVSGLQRGQLLERLSARSITREAVCRVEIERPGELLLQHGDRHWSSRQRVLLQHGDWHWGSRQRVLLRERQRQSGGRRVEHRSAGDGVHPAARHRTVRVREERERRMLELRRMLEFRHERHLRHVIQETALLVAPETCSDAKRVSHTSERLLRTEELLRAAGSTAQVAGGRRVMRPCRVSEHQWRHGRRRPLRQRVRLRGRSGHLRAAVDGLLLHSDLLRELLHVLLHRHAAALRVRRVGAVAAVREPRVHLFFRDATCAHSAACVNK